MSRFRRPNAQCFNFRRWCVLCLGVNPKTNTFCCTYEDHQAISKGLYFGSLDIFNRPLDELTVDAATERLAYHQSTDVFVLMMQPISWSEFNEVRNTFEAAARRNNSGREALAFGMLLDGRVWASQDIFAQKPICCPNWDPAKDFPMPDGTVISGLRVCSSVVA